MKTVLLGHAFHQTQDSLTNQAWWQVFIVLLTTFCASSLTYFFTNKSNKRALFVTAKSNLSSYAYQLDQVVTSYLESLLNSYYYMAAINNTVHKDQERFFDLMKMEGLRTPELALEISRTQGKMIKEFSIIKQLVASSDLVELQGIFNEIVYFESYDIPRPDSEITEQKAKKYAEDNLKLIKKNSTKLKNKIANLDNCLQSTDLRFFPPFSKVSS